MSHFFKHTNGYHFSKPYFISEHKTNTMKPGGARHLAQCPIPPGVQQLVNRLQQFGY